MTQYPEHDHKQRAEMYKKLEKDRQEDILTYRDKTFVSTISGNKALEPSSPWTKKMDYVLEDYTKNVG